jgi:hypothetical protein
MNVIQNLISELREKRLWPVAAALIVALVAVPVLLSSSSKPAPVVQAPVASGSAVAPVPALPAVSVTTTPSNARLTGPERDPFTQQAKASSGATGSTAAAATSGSGTSAASAGTSSSSGPSDATNPNDVAPPFNSVNPSSKSTSTNTKSTTKPAAAKPTTYSYYDINLVYDRVGSVPSTRDELPRLAPLPNADDPLAVYYGVENDHKTAVFLLSRIVAPVRGEGKCAPSRSDCVFLDLKAGQAELFEVVRPSGTSEFTLTLTDLKTLTTTSAAKAKQARAIESKAGRKIVARAGRQSIALRMFVYSEQTGTLSRVQVSKRLIGRSIRVLGVQAILGPILEPLGTVLRLVPAS